MAFPDEFQHHRGEPALHGQPERGGQSEGGIVRSWMLNSRAHPKFHSRRLNPPRRPRRQNRAIFSYLQGNGRLRDSFPQNTLGIRLRGARFGLDLGGRGAESASSPAPLAVRHQDAPANPDHPIFTCATALATFG
jgi:hypothetical protein